MRDNISRQGSIFLSLFDGPGRDASIDVLVGSVALRGLAMSGEPVSEAVWPSCGSGLHQVVGPLDRETWARLSRPEDLVIVITRDPRDIVASLAADPAFAPGLSLNDRERSLAAITVVKSQERSLRSWARRRTTSSELLSTYERLVSDEASFLADLAAFVGQAPSAPSLDLFGHTRQLRVVPDRAGEIGAWSHVFDRDLAAVFEQAMPDLIVDLGYGDPNWAEACDGRRSANDGRPAPASEPSTPDPFFLFGDRRRGSSAAG